MSASTALMERIENGGKPVAKGLPALIEEMKPQFARALPASIPAERFTRLALTAIRSNPGLAKCQPESVLGALMTASQLGLEPNTPLGEAYLIPYGATCTFVPGYQGLLKLAWQSGLIKTISVETVHENDHFKRVLGLHPDLIHEVDDSRPRGDVIGVYAVVHLRDGGVQFAYMSKQDLEAHRKRYVKGGRGESPWDTSEWMLKKTVLRQVLKLVPRSTELGWAISQDGAVRTDLSFDSIDVVDADTIDAEVVDQTTGEITPV